MKNKLTSATEHHLINYVNGGNSVDQKSENELL